MQTDIFSFRIDSQHSVRLLAGDIIGENEFDRQMKAIADEIVLLLRQDDISCEVSSVGLFYACVKVIDPSSSVLLRFKYGDKIENHYSIDKFGNTIS